MSMGKRVVAVILGLLVLGSLAYAYDQGLFDSIPALPGAASTSTSTSTTTTTTTTAVAPPPCPSTKTSALTEMIGSWTSLGGPGWVSKDSKWYCKPGNVLFASQAGNNRYLNCGPELKNSGEGFVYTPSDNVVKGDGAWVGNTCPAGGRIPVTVNGDKAVLGCCGAK